MKYYWVKDVKHQSNKYTCKEKERMKNRSLSYPLLAMIKFHCTDDSSSSVTSLNVHETHKALGDMSSDGGIPARAFVNGSGYMQDSDNTDQTAVISVYFTRSYWVKKYKEVENCVLHPYDVFFLWMSYNVCTAIHTLT